MKKNDEIRCALAMLAVSVRNEKAVQAAQKYLDERSKSTRNTLPLSSRFCKIVSIVYSIFRMTEEEVARVESYIGRMW